MNLRQMINMFLQKTGTNITSNLTLSTVIDYLNRARLTMVTEGIIGVDRTYGFPSEENQEFYALPDDWLGKFSDIMWYQKTSKVEFVDKELFLRQRQHSNTPGLPRIWTVFDGKFRIWPPPSAAAPSATVATSFGGGSSVTIALVNNDDFPNTGLIRIDLATTIDSLAMSAFDFIRYLKKTLNGSNMDLTVLQRGLQDTGVGSGHTSSDTAVVCDLEVDYFSKGKDFLITPEGGTITIASGGSLTASKRYQAGYTLTDAVSGEYSLLNVLGALSTDSSNKTIDFADLPSEVVSDANRVLVLGTYITEGDGDLFYGSGFVKIATKSITSNPVTTALNSYIENLAGITPTLEQHGRLTQSNIPDKYHKAHVFMACKEHSEDKREWDLVNLFTSNFNDAMQKAQSLEQRDHTRKQNQMLWTPV